MILAHLTSATQMTPIIWILTISILGPMILAAVLMVLALIFDFGDWAMDTIMVLLGVAAVSSIVIPLIGMTMEALS